MPIVTSVSVYYDDECQVDVLMAYSSNTPPTDTTFNLKDPSGFFIALDECVFNADAQGNNEYFSQCSLYDLSTYGISANQNVEIDAVATNIAGTSSSAHGNEFLYTAKTPDSPTELQITDRFPDESNEARVTWKKVQGVREYKLEFSMDRLIWLTIYTNDNDYYATNLDDEEIYFRVSSKGSCGYSSPSEIELS